MIALDAEQKVQIKRDELKVVGTLGKGSFGHVQLMIVRPIRLPLLVLTCCARQQDPKTNKTYALKVC